MSELIIYGHGPYSSATKTTVNVSATTYTDAGDVIFDWSYDDSVYALKAVTLRFTTENAMYDVYTNYSNNGGQTGCGTFRGSTTAGSTVNGNIAQGAWFGKTSGSIGARFKKYSSGAVTNTHCTGIQLVLEVEELITDVDSDVTVDIVNVGESQTATLINANPEVSHIVQWRYFGKNQQNENTVIQSDTITLNAATRTVSWSIPSQKVEEIYRKYTNTQTASGNLIVQTIKKNGNPVTVGGVTHNISLNIPSSAVGPVYGGMTITSSTQSTIPYLQNYSTLTVVPTFTPQYGATINTIRITTTDYAEEKSATNNSATFSFIPRTAGYYSIQVSATDSRGNSVTGTAQVISVVECSAPVFTTLDIDRCTNAGVLDDEETYALIRVLSQARIAGSDASISYVAKAWESTVPTTSIPYITSSSFTTSIQSPTYIFGDSTKPLSPEKSYTVHIIATATGTVNGTTITQSTTAVLYIGTSTYTIYRMAGGKGVAFGKIAEKQGVEVKENWPFYTHGKEIEELLVDIAHPIGSIIESLDASFDPNASWPWTHWSLLKDCFLYGAGTEDVLSSGGSNSTPFSFSIPAQTITLTVDNLPRTTIIGAGSIDAVFGPNGNQNYEAYKGSAAVDKRNHGNVTGYAYYDLKRDPDSITVPGGSVNTSIPTMPPYIAVNIWTRIQ